MAKIRITVQNEEKVEIIEADKFVLVSQDEDRMTVTRSRATDAEVLGLLELGGYQVKNDWKKANSND